MLSGKGLKGQTQRELLIAERTENRRELSDDKTIRHVRQDGFQKFYHDVDLFFDLF